MRCTWRNDHDLGRQVALKLVRPELMIYPGGDGTIPRKLLLASKISHPYQDLFALWKEAVHNIPVLQEEKAEYARLQ